MNNNLGKITALVLAVLIVVSAFSGLSFSAAESDDESIAVTGAEDYISAVGETVPETQPETEPETVPVDPEPVVGKVTNIVRNSKGTNLMEMEWDPVDGATGYYVYLCNADVSSVYKKLAAVTKTKYTITNLTQATQYYVGVSAYIKKDGKIYEGPQTVKKTATQPTPITGLTKWTSSTTLTMDWTVNTKATGYRIYRKEGSGAEKLVKTIYGYKNNEFADKNVKQGVKYTYRVKAFRDLYGTTYNSQTAPSLSFLAGLCAPDYSIASRCQRVNLTWNKNKYATHYEIYMSESPDNSKFKKIFTTPRLYYNTTKLTKGKTYYFRVLPIYQSGGTTITGTSLKKSAKVQASAYGTSTGSTYIEICIAQQHMWVYKNGTQIASTDVVTGTRYYSDTPKGYHYIYDKERNTTLVGADYASFVSFWMPFYGGCGIHDSSWRSSYGGSIYQTSGSHGCVNTPYSAVKTIYNNISIGTPVIIY